MANVHGTNGNDSLTGGSSNDTITPLLGIDSVDGLGGTDTLIIDYSALSDNITSSWNYFSDSRYNSVTFYNIEKLNVTTGSGDDHLTGGAAADTLASGAGYDFLIGGGGTDSIDGGAGVDTWSENYSSTGSAISITLKAATDGSGNTSSTVTIGSAAGPTVKNVEALSMQTGSGNDKISVGTLGYSDNISTNNGDDQINVGTGGSDYVNGGNGVDVGIFDWSKSTSNITVDPYYDDYADDEGRSINFDSVERFNAIGGSGNDHLAGDIYNDTLLGGSGRDTLESGRGADSVDGGAGTDLWKADYSTATAAINVTLNSTGVNEILAGIKGGLLYNVESLSFTSGSGNDVISSAPFAYTDVVYSNGGNDTINVGKGGVDYVQGGDGIDVGIFDWSASTGNITGGTYYDDYADGQGRSVNFDAVERFNLTGGAGDDYLGGDAYSDTLNGGSGMDTLEGASGGDTINGGDGVDLWRANYGGSTDAIKVQLSSTTSTNEVLAGIKGGVVKGIEQLDFTSGSGNDVISTAPFAYNDAIYSNGGDDSINVGKGGSDYVQGGDGVDLGIFDWSASSTDITGGTYYDDYSDGEGRAVNFDAVERFNFTGGSGNDYLGGDSWNDTLKGGSGRDTLEGGSFRADVSMGNVDSIDGGNGVDLWSADYSSLTQSIQVQLTSASGVNEVLSGISDGDAKAVVKNIERLSINSGSGDDTISAGSLAYNDRIYTNDGDDFIDVGTGGSDYVNGGGGVDIGKFDWSASTTSIVGDSYYDDYSDHEGRYVNFDSVDRFDLLGGSGNDSLYGDNYSDTLSGGAGNDWLYAYGGDDSLTGGSGADWFYFSGGNGEDTITDFAEGQGAGDVVYFTYHPFDTMDFATIQSHMTQSGSEVILTLTETDSIHFMNTTVGNFSSDDFLWA